MILDAYAIVAFLRREPCSDEVAALLREPTSLSAANAAEVFDQMVRVFGIHPDDVHGDLALLVNEGMTIVPVTPEEGLSAGRLRARHYQKEWCAVSLADCIAAASALARRQPLATADPALAAVVRAEGGEIYPLADSKGVTS